jgi:hypothetical protein
MNDVLIIEIPVTPEAAEALGDLARDSGSENS